MKNRILCYLFLCRKKVLRHGLLCLVLLVQLFFPDVSFAQGSCTINAGGNEIICGSSTTLNASGGGSFSGGPEWFFVSGPVTPVIESPNSMSTNVTGMTNSGNYIFRVTRLCENGSTANSQVTITARPKPATFTAGPDITNICATVGTTSLSGVIPAGFTGQWRAENIYSRSRYSTTESGNSEFSDNTIAAPVFSLINKADHELDPAYLAILRITSLDGICSYEDTAVVRFIPNPVIKPQLDNYMCLDPDYVGPDPHYFYLESAPYFDTYFTGSAGTVASGTNVTLNVVSQPSGGNISFKNIDNQIVVLDGINVTGVYKFTLKVENDCGSYTTPEISYEFSGERPHAVTFQPSGHGAPEQLMIYYVSASGGEVHCSAKVGSTTPEVFYFSIHPSDQPDLISSVEPSGIIPPGGAPAVVVSGAGTYNRYATVTPPAGGWRVGTYKFSVYINNVDGSCGSVQDYYIHVSDGNRPNVSVPDQAVCYPGTGAVSATIPLPAVYKGVVNASYFQDFDGRYEFEVISQPAGSSDPEFTTDNLRLFTLSSTTISNLDKAGDYVFRITAKGYNSDVGPFLDQEYACSGTSLSSTFTIRVENLINANAGSDQDVSYETSASIAGNLPGTGTGHWSWVGYPAGATPSIVDPNTNLTTVNGMTKVGIYELEWTITSLYGGCVSKDRVQLISSAVLPVSIIVLEAARSGNTALLNWHTATETDNRGFEVERSTDGSSWQTIGFVSSKANGGNSSSRLTYSFIDNTPYNGVNYYRLKQVDMNGASEYTATRQLNFGNSSVTVKMYPNPAKSTVSLTGVEVGSVIRVEDALGKTVLTTVRTADLQSAGIINIAGLPRGIYMVVINSRGGDTITRKLIKD
ncbi:PKD domain-containing protein [Polluticaenibacter yanchengensis]|uniref:T9SS type A sorting domain-containing protein n=1 Tax=Polluticaenibacter yanchengensis TaxID=3014562 RepID=A0ABT4ULL5_9BACT|nr:T9SS type A sorting domain-containing protein [Chitinophagaceae bacterium LY-5]